MKVLRVLLLVSVPLVLAACERTVGPELEPLAVSEDALLPDLVPLEAEGFSLDAEGKEDALLLRFDTTSWNAGQGALELVPKGTVTGDDDVKRQIVDQRVYLEDGSTEDHPVGHFTYHEEHDHVHFDEFAKYRLYEVGDASEPNAKGDKTSFCLLDTDRIDHKLPGAPKRRQYTECDNGTQGISVGWGDTYGAELEGQWVDVTGLSDGDYRLEIAVDPKGDLYEADTGDNVSETYVRLSGMDTDAPSVEVIAPPSDDEDEGDDGGGNPGSGGGGGNGNCPHCG